MMLSTEMAPCLTLPQAFHIEVAYLAFSPLKETFYICPSHANLVLQSLVLLLSQTF